MRCAGVRVRVRHDERVGGPQEEGARYERRRGHSRSTGSAQGPYLNTAGARRGVHAEKGLPTVVPERTVSCARAREMKAVVGSE